MIAVSDWHGQRRLPLLVAGGTKNGTSSGSVERRYPPSAFRGGSP